MLCESHCVSGPPRPQQKMNRNPSVPQSPYLSFWAAGCLSRGPGLVAVKPLGKMIILVLVFAVLGRFLANVGPKTPLNGSGLKNITERSEN